MDRFGATEGRSGYRKHLKELLTGSLVAAGDVYTASDEHCEILQFGGFGRRDAWGF